MNSLFKSSNLKQSILVALIMLVCSPANAQFNLDNLMKSVREAAAARSNTTKSTTKSGTTTTQQTSKTTQQTTATAQFNNALFGKFGEKSDFGVSLELNKKATANKEFKNAKTYGTIAISNEYFEYEYIMHITAITPKGNNIVADITITQLQGDIEAGDYSYVTKGKTKVTICPVTGGVKIYGCDKIASNLLVRLQ